MDLDQAKLLPHLRNRNRRTIQRACTICGKPSPGSRCPEHTDQRSREERGYDHTHRQTRAQLLPLAIGTRCPICREPMREDQPLELHHSVPLAQNPAARGDQIVHRRCHRNQTAA